jgi:hypothetical protein
MERKRKMRVSGERERDKLSSPFNVSENFFMDCPAGTLNGY